MTAYLITRLPGLTTPIPRDRQGERNESHVIARLGARLGQPGAMATPPPPPSEGISWERLYQAGSDRPVLHVNAISGN
jgi:hypothetical protein